MWQNNLVEIFIDLDFLLKRLLSIIFLFFQCKALFIVRTLNKKKLFNEHNLKRRTNCPALKARNILYKKISSCDNKKRVGEKEWKNVGRKKRNWKK